MKELRSTPLATVSVKDDASEKNDWWWCSFFPPRDMVDDDSILKYKI